MRTNNSLKDTIFNIATHADFNNAALQVFKWQAERNKIYNAYLNALNTDVSAIKNWREIPFLPIDFFKTEKVVTGNFEPQQQFTSSGTTGQTPSSHYVADVKLYEESFMRAFTQVYGAPENKVILALLPAYLERTGSSLVYMANALIKKSTHPASGFYLNNLEELYATLQQLAKNKTPTILLGVSFALLDLAEMMPANFTFSTLTVMETGGMKGRKKEIIRTDLHSILKSAFKVEAIHSEYGMTELLSQAYATANGLFKTPPWMRVVARDTTDPLTLVDNEVTGGLNIIDLANVHSCAFIATQDLGRVYANQTFEVLGRFDTAEIRGCNLMAL